LKFKIKEIINSALFIEIEGQLSLCEILELIKLVI